MFKNRALKSITCVAHLDSDIHPQSTRIDRKKTGDGNSPRIFEIPNEVNCNTDTDSLESKRHSKEKSHIHRKWSKLKKYFSGNNGSQSSTDRDHEFGQSNSSTKRIAGEREMDKSSLEVSMKNVNNVLLSRDQVIPDKTEEFQRSQNYVEIPSITESTNLLDYNSTENVKRWLNTHHQDSKKLKAPKSKRHIHHLKGIQVYEAEVFEPLYHHHSHVTHRKKYHSAHNSAGRTPSSHSSPVMSLPKPFELQKNFEKSENKEPSKCLQQPSNKESLGSLNPSLVNFMAELINSLEKLQRSNNSEMSETKLMSHLSTNNDATKIAPKISRHLSDASLHQFKGNRSFNCATQKFSTSTPKEKGENKKIHQSSEGLKAELDEFPSGSFSITPSATASINEKVLKVRLDGKELTYNFQKDPQDLIKGMKDAHKSSIRMQEDIFSIYEFVVNIQSRIIKDLHSELERSTGNDLYSGLNASKQNSSAFDK